MRILTYLYVLSNMAGTCTDSHPAKTYIGHKISQDGNSEEDVAAFITKLVADYSAHHEFAKIVKTVRTIESEGKNALTYHSIALRFSRHEHGRRDSGPILQNIHI